MSAGIFLPDVRDYVIRPVLAVLGAPYDSVAAERLLLGTLAHESKGGRWLDQTTPGPGPAFGIFQMEHPTYLDTLHRVGIRNPDLLKSAGTFRGAAPDGCAQMAGNLYWATAIARLKYWLAPPALPPPDDIEALGRYWKAHWNTEAGKGTVPAFLLNWRDHVAPYV